MRWMLQNIIDYDKWSKWLWENKCRKKWQFICRFKVVRPRYWNIRKKCRKWKLISKFHIFHYQIQELTLYALPLGLFVAYFWTSSISILFRAPGKSKQISAWFKYSEKIHLLALLWVPFHLPILVSHVAMDMDCVRTIHAKSIVIFPVDEKTFFLLTNPEAGHFLKNYFETVAGLFAIPNCVRQWEFASDSVFSDRSECTATQFFRFNVVRFHPQSL